MPEDKENSIWGLRVRSLRAIKGWSRQELADTAGAMSMDVVNRIERGDVRKPRDDKQTRLAQALGVSVGYLLTGKPHDANDPEIDILDVSIGSATDYSHFVGSKPGAAQLASPTKRKKTELLDEAQKATTEINKNVFKGELTNEQCNKIFGVIYNQLVEVSEQIPE